MCFTFGNVWRSILIIVGTALTWDVIFDLNSWLFSQFSLSERVHWIFLPAAFRIIFVLLFQGRGAVGLIFGAYLTQSQQTLNELPNEMLLSISSGLAPLVAVVFCQRFFTINNNLAGLNGWHIIALSVASAAANTVILNAILYLMGRQAADLESIEAVFVGDVLGAAIVITAISLTLSGVLTLMKRTRQS